MKEERIDLSASRHPVVYEVNTRLFLNEISLRDRKKVTLSTLPDRVIDEWADLGFQAVWLMGVWTTGRIGLDLARSFALGNEEFRRALPDLTADDVIGSPYAIQAYEPAASVGGTEGLCAIRRKLARRNIGLVLDFVANHTARDHPWVRHHPEYYIAGTRGDLRSMPDRYFSAPTHQGERVLAYGRDPYFPGWTDTAQVNIMHPGARAALIREIGRVADLCDGVRCDMAMLLIRDVFLDTWGGRLVGGAPPKEEFWEEAIGETRRSHPGFQFLAEAYWDLEWRLQQMGFDYTYDKVLYDRMLREGAASVRQHLQAAPDFQRRSIRFIENHDERPAASAFPTVQAHFAAATLASTLPGMILLHEGQLEGRLERVPVQLGRRKEEPPSPAIKGFYTHLLKALKAPVFMQGEWRLIDVRAAWSGNPTDEDLLATWWEGKAGSARCIVVNYAPHSSQGYIAMPVRSAGAGNIVFRDLLGDAVYVRDRASLMQKGMFFDMPPYGFHLFEVKDPKPR